MIAKQEGFTIIELLVVIAIIAILSGILLPQIGSFRAEGRTARRVNDLTEIKAALELYYADTRTYPSSGGDWDEVVSDGANWIAGLAPNYIKFLPRDPRNNTVTSQQYLYLSDTVNYKLIASDPEDCNPFFLTNPALVDPARDGGTDNSVIDGTACTAIGHWTAGAISW